MDVLFLPLIFLVTYRTLDVWHLGSVETLQPFILMQLIVCMREIFLQMGMKCGIGLVLSMVLVYQKCFWGMK